MGERICSVEGCERQASKRGWCSAHYSRWYRHGSLELPPRAARKPSPIRTCSVEGCSAKHATHGFCWVHYGKVKRYGDPLAPNLRVPNKVCSIEDCASKHFVHGLCKKHYSRWRNSGDPLDRPVRILAEECTARTTRLSDDVCWPWLDNLDRYGTVRWEGRNIKAYRAVFMVTYGAIPKGMSVDHLCRRHGCVNPLHLQAVTHAENLRRSRISAEEHFALGTFGPVYGGVRK